MQCKSSPRINLQWPFFIHLSVVITKKRWSTSCYWTGKRGTPVKRTRIFPLATRLVRLAHKRQKVWHIENSLNKNWWRWLLVTFHPVISRSLLWLHSKCWILLVYSLTHLSSSLWRNGIGIPQWWIASTVDVLFCFFIYYHQTLTLDTYCCRRKTCN